MDGGWNGGRIDGELDGRWDEREMGWLEDGADGRWGVRMNWMEGGME